MTTTNAEIVSFVAAVYCCSSEGREPITIDEAQYTINAWNEEGIEIPDGFTAELYAKYWNEFCEGGQ